jgi:hypothetical protein
MRTSPCLVALLLVAACGDSKPSGRAEGASSGDRAADRVGAKAPPTGQAVAPTPTTPATAPPLPADAGEHTGAHRLSIRLGGPEADAGRAIAVGPDGGLAVGGYLRGAAELGGAKLAAVEGADGLIASLDATGKVRWARTLGGKGDDAVEAVAVAADGAVVAAGAFSYTIDMPDGALASKGADDVMVVAFAPDGTRRWARRFGGDDVDAANGVAIATDGAIYVVGELGGAATIGSSKLESAGLSDLLVIKLAADGAPIWARRFGGPGADLARAVRIAPDGDVVVLGEMSREVDFGGGPLEAAGNRDAVVLKLGPDGSYRWATRFGGTNDELALGLAVDPVGSVAVTGSFDDKLTFGADTVASAGLADVFVAKLSPSGAPMWIRTFGAKEADLGVGLAADAAGNLYAVGWFWYEVMVDRTKLVSGGRKDAFALALAPDGRALWAKRFGGKENDFLQGLAATEDGIVAAGTFHGTVSFGGEELTPAAAPGAQLPLGDLIVLGLAR